jgi:hypothetical protein
MAPESLHLPEGFEGPQALTLMRLAPQPRRSSGSKHNPVTNLVLTERKDR